MGAFVNTFHNNDYEWWVRKNSSSDQCLTVGQDLVLYENDCIQNTHEGILRKPLCLLGYNFVHQSICLTL